MSQIVTHSNILNPHAIAVLPTTARHSDEILKDLLIAEGFEVILSKNSVIMDAPFEIVEGDIINVMFVPQGGGGGKNILSMVAMIAVAVFAPQLAYQLGTLVMGGAPLTAVTAAVFTTGVMVAGALLVNAVFGAAIPTSSLNMDSFENSVTYSWDESFNQFKQGIPVPKVYGTHKITPPLISKYIETIDNKQYFNGLYAVNDGLISNLYDLKINDESIDNFDNVTIQVRNGANVQGLIGNFDNTFSDRSVNKKLSTAWADTETNGNQVTGLNTVLVFPRGIYYTNDEGEIRWHSVKVVFEYSSDGVNWTNFGSDPAIPEYWYHEEVAFGDIDGTYIVKYTAYDGTPIASGVDVPHDAISYTGGSPDDVWYYTPSYVVPYTTIRGTETSTIRKTFKLNYLAPSKYHVRARFYEAPPTTARYGNDCYLEYITEEVGDDFTYPNTALISVRALATDQLSGGTPKVSCIVSANSSNPALTCKQMLLEAGISTDRILPSFAEWEAHCNTMGYTCNIVFDTSMNLRKALDTVSALGRASVVQFGSKFEAIMDRAESIPVQSFTFGMGNILKDSFKQQFLPILDRANVIEMTYYDANLDYDATIIEVSNTNYDSVAEENRTAVTLVGCTNRTQAIKQARYMLNCNRYLTETVTLEADKDSLVCKYGDIVRVSHDVPQYGFSGRIVACSTTSVTLDRDVEIESGKAYYIQIRDSQNNVKEHTVINALGITDSLEFTTPLTTPYAQYDNYAFGEIGKASKLYRVLKIGTSSDLTRTLSLLEYNEDVYNDAGVIDIPDISAFGISNLRATDYIRYSKDGSIETVMQVAWSGLSLYYTVQYKKSGGAFQSVKVYDQFLDLVVEDVSYDIIVTDSNGDSATLNYAVQGKTTPPEAVTNLSSVELQDEFRLTWEYENYPLDFAAFEIYVNGVLLFSQKTNTCLVPIKESKQVVRIYAVDTTNNKSEFVEVTLIAQNLEDIEAINALYENNQQNLYWLKIISDKSPILYEIRKGLNWDFGQVVGLSSESTFKAVTNGDYMVKPLYTTKYGAKIYSQNFATVLVDGSSLPKNVIALFDEHLTWEGLKTNTFIYDGNLTLASDVLFDDISDFDGIVNFDFPNNTVFALGYYESTNIVNLSAPQLCKVSVDFNAYAENMVNFFDAIEDFDAVTNFDGYTAGEFFVNVQIAISQDGVVFGSWKPFTAGDYLGQSFKVRLVLISTNQNLRPIVEAFSFSIDMPDRFEQGTATTPQSVLFSKPFNMTPYTQITLSNAVAGDDIQLTNETNGGFTLNVKNNGSDVVRTCNWYSSGY